MNTLARFDTHKGVAGHLDFANSRVHSVLASKLKAVNAPNTPFVWLVWVIAQVGVETRTQEREYRKPRGYKPCAIFQRAKTAKLWPFR